LYQKIKNKTIILIIIVFFFYFITILVSDFNKILLELKSIKIEYYIPIFSLTVLTLLIGGWRYQLILKTLDINLKFKECFIIFLAGLSMLITPGGSGALIKSYILKKKLGKSISSTTPIIIYEKWIELLSVVIVIGFLLIKVSYVESIFVFIIGLILVSTLFILFKNTVGLQFLNKKFQKIPFLRKFIINLDEFKITTSILLKPKITIQILLVTMMTKIIPLFIVFLIFKSLDSHIDFFEGGQIYFTSVLAGVLSFIPGGIIITETGLLGTLLNYGTDISTASILVILLRFVTLWFPVMLGFVALKIIYRQDTMKD
jgi:glycosyltransferase 2 family protein